MKTSLNSRARTKLSNEQIRTNFAPRNHTKKLGRISKVGATANANGDTDTNDSNSCDK